MFDIMESEIYCTYISKKVKVNVCMDCNKLYECDVNWCDNHKCKNCEHKQEGMCKGMY